MLFLTSCSEPAPPVPDVKVAAADPQPKVETKAPAPPEKKGTPVVEPPKKTEPPPPSEFPFPNDAAGKALPAVVAPPKPAAPAVEKFGQAQTPRSASNAVVDRQALPRMRYAPPPLLPVESGSIAPTAPVELVPVDLGFGAAAVPNRPMLPETPGITTKARDVKIPPDLPPLGRQVPDRASLDDPTSESGNAAIVQKSPQFILAVAAFLKVALPDPFELAEQIKIPIPAAAEPNAAPVPVNPQRIK